MTAPLQQGTPAPDSVMSADPAEEQPHGRLRQLVRLNSFWIAIALVVEIVAFATLLPQGTFLSPFNLQSIAADSAVVLMLATAATLVIITGGIDLSLGSVLTVSAVVAGKLITVLAPSSEGLALVAGIVAAVVMGALVGAFNGYLIAHRRLPAFVVTLGTMTAALGVARLLSGGVGISGAPKMVTVVGQGEVFGVPVPFLIAMVILLCFAIVLGRTRYGEYTYVIGSNIEAATRGGIAVNRHLMSIYVVAGILAGLAGFIDFSRFESASVTTGHSSENIAGIAAVVIGGASLSGGIGSLSGTAVGVYIPVILANGLVIGGIERFWQDVIIGIILVAAVSFDQWRRTTHQ